MREALPSGARGPEPAAGKGTAAKDLRRELTRQEGACRRMRSYPRVVGLCPPPVPSTGPGGPLSQWCPRVAFLLRIALLFGARSKQWNSLRTCVVPSPACSVGGRPPAGKERPGRLCGSAPPPTGSQVPQAPPPRNRPCCSLSCENLLGGLEIVTVSGFSNCYY